MICDIEAGLMPDMFAFEATDKFCVRNKWLRLLKILSHERKRERKKKKSKNYF